MKVIIRDNLSNDYWRDPRNGECGIEEAYVYDTENEEDWGHVMRARRDFSENRLTLINVTDMKL
jgi:hypothetical protein